MENTSHDMKLRKILESSTIVLKQPSLNEQLDFDQLILFRNGVMALAYILSSCFISFILNFNMANSLNFNPFTATRYPTWLKNIQLAFCKPYGGVKTILKESFPYVT